jgi:hypothetical protein
MLEKGKQKVLIEGKEYDLCFNLRKISKVNQYFRKTKILGGKTPLGSIIAAVGEMHSMKLDGASDLESMASIDVGVDVVAPLLAFGLEHEKELKMNVERAFDIIENADENNSETYLVICIKVAQAFFLAHGGGGMLATIPANKAVDDDEKKPAKKVRSKQGI